MAMLRRFIRQVAMVVETDAALAIVGPGSVPEDLVRVETVTRLTAIATAARLVSVATKTRINA